jgi:signal transduction histidine kinase
MSAASIRFSPSIFQRLGEELNPNPDQGILELVKNAYDADARSCRIELIDVDAPGGRIRVTDDGEGMTLDDIRQGWLVLGKSKKTMKRTRRLRRVPAGSKGLGRLAALRMGESAHLTTRPQSEATRQYEITIEWADYDGVEAVEDVELDITSSKRGKDATDGTEIEVVGLESSITRTEVKRLARALILLADPFQDDPEGFRPELVTPEFEDLEKLVGEKYFHDADYHLTAKVNQHGVASARVLDWRGQKLFSARHSDIAVSRKGERYECPPATFDLWVFILQKKTFVSRSSTLGEVKNWLREFGGVHLYHNGLRVAPYGNPGNDWLDMNLRRAQNPEERPSTNTVIGRVAVTGGGDLLVQKTDRSGFIEGEAFHELQAFAAECLEWFARERLEVAEHRRRAERTRAAPRRMKAKATLEKAIEKAPSRNRGTLKTAFERYDRSREREVVKLRKEVQLYRTLSTAGITAATFAHESSGNPIKAISQAIKAIERRGRETLKAAYRKSLEKPVETIKRSVGSLAVLGDATLSLLDHGKRRQGRVNLHDVVQGVVETFDPFLKGRDVALDLQLYKGKPYLRGSEAAVESIITNLLNNSLVALEQSSTRKRQISVRTELNGDYWVLRVLDNGPGIEGIGPRTIWLPGETTRPNGTGLGLTIVRDAVVDLGGEVGVEEHGELGGAEFVVELPIIGA